MRTGSCLLALVGLITGGVTLGGCSRDKPATSAAPAGSGTPAPGAAAAPAQAPGGRVEIFVNDAPVAMVEPAHLASWPRVDTLVQGDARRLGTWEVVTLQGASPTPIDVSRPSATYPDMVPAIFPGEGGGAAFGMFDPVELAKKGKPALREDNIKTVRIKLATSGDRGGQHDDSGGGGDPTKLVLTVKTPAGTTTMTGDKLLALPREPMPGHPDQQGWRVAALLEAAGVKTYQRLVLSDATGTNLTLDKKDVSDTSVPFVKLNKQGALRLRVLQKVGEGWNIGGDLRALVAIDAK